jgi:hypothetical protein
MAYSYSFKSFYIEDILRIAWELTDLCTPEGEWSGEELQYLAAVQRGVRMMADKLIDEIEKKDEVK